MDRVKSLVANQTNNFPKRDDKYSKRDSQSRAGILYALYCICLYIYRLYFRAFFLLKERFNR